MRDERAGAIASHLLSSIGAGPSGEHATRRRRRRKRTPGPAGERALTRPRGAGILGAVVGDQAHRNAAGERRVKEIMSLRGVTEEEARQMLAGTYESDPKKRLALTEAKALSEQQREPTSGARRERAREFVAANRDFIVQNPDHPVAKAMLQTSGYTLDELTKPWQMLSDLGAAAVGIPMGLATLAKGGYADTGELLHGNPTFPHTRRNAAAIGEGFYQDFRHPTRHPGFTLLDILGALGAAAGTAGRAGAAGAAVKEGAGAGEALKAFARGNPPQTFKITARAPHDVFDEQGNHIGTEMRDLSVDKLLSNNPVWRELVQRPRYAGLQRALDEGPRSLEQLPAPLRRVMELYERTYSPQTRFGRELRAQRRVEQTASQAPLGELARAVGSEAAIKIPRKLRAGLSRGEQKLLQLVSIEGDRVLSSPEALDQVIDLHIAKHERHRGHANERADLEAAGFRHHDLPQELQGEHGTAYAHDRQIADLELAREAGHLILQGKGTTHLRGGERFPQALESVRQLMHIREKELIRRGLLDEEGAKIRVAQPAAEYRDLPLEREVVTGVKAGAVKGESTFMRQIGIQREVGKLDKHLETLDRHLMVAKGRMRPRTLAEAEQRLGHLEGNERAVFETFFGKGKLDPAQLREQLRRNRINGLIDAYERSGTTRRGTHAALRTGRQPSVVDELRQQAMRDFENFIERNRQHPTVERVLTHREEADALREGITHVRSQMRKTADEFGLEHGPFTPLNMTHAEKIEHLGGVEGSLDPRLADRMRRMEIEKATVARIREQRANELKGIEDRLGQPTGKHAAGITPYHQEVKYTLGSEKIPYEAPPGAFYGPLQAARDLDRANTTGTHARPAGLTGEAIKETSVGRTDSSLTHTFSGRIIRAGRFSIHMSKASAASYHKMVRLVSALDTYDRLWAISTPLRRSEFDKPIIEVSRLPNEVRDMFTDAERRLPLRQEEIEKLTGEQVEQLQKYLHPEKYLDEWGDHTRDGVRWIDTRYLSDLGDLNPPKGWHKVFDAVNNPVRFLAVYGRVAYILNLPGNMGMQALHQGFLAPANYARALTMRGELVRHFGETEGGRVASLAESFVGEGKSRSYAVPTGFLQRPANALANWWSSWIDRYSRLSALVHEARRHGADISFDPFRKDWTREEAESFRGFLDSNTTERTAAVRRANKQLVEFNNLTPFERNTIRHLIFLYPWVSRATVWSFRTMIEHPGEASVLAQIGRMGNEELARELGPLPAYLKDRGYFPAFFKGKDAFLVNPTSLNTFQTAFENGHLLASLVFGAPKAALTGKPREAVSPALDLLVGALQGETARGRESPGLIGAFRETIGSLPELQALQRAGVPMPEWLSSAPQPKGDVAPERQRVFAETSVLQGLGPFLLGGMFPRKANLDAAHAKAEQEQRLSMSVVERTTYDLGHGFKDALSEARRVGVITGTPDPTIVKAWGFYRQRQVAYARSATDAGVSLQDFGQLERLKVDYRLLVQAGLLRQSEVDQVLSELEREKATDDDIESIRRRLHTHFFGQQVLSDFKRRVKDAGGEIGG